MLSHGIELDQSDKKKDECKSLVLLGHLHLIEIASKLTTTELTDQINTLDVLFNVDFPELNGRNLFHVVLENKELDDKTKFQLIRKLMDRGYVKYTYNFLNARMIDLISGPDFNELLREVYIKNQEYADSHKVENKIWDILLKNRNYGFALLNDFYRCFVALEKKIQFIKYWFSTCSDAHDIICLNEDIMKSIKNIESDLNSGEEFIKSFKIRNSLSHHIPYIKKLAQLRILAVSQKDKSSSNEEEVKNFLMSTEPRFFNHFRRRYSSYDIYKMICDNKPEEARKAYFEKCVRAEQRSPKVIAGPEQEDAPGDCYDYLFCT